jgi:polyvinyl alcohol dehydrogenase (cytochrome)
VKVEYSIVTSQEMQWVLASLCTIALFVQTFAGSSWDHWGNDLGNTRLAVEKSLSVANIGHLIPRWNFTTGGDVSVTPTIATIGSTLTAFFTDYAGNLYAVDARNGTVIWTKRIPEYTRNEKSITRTSIAVANDLLVMGDQKSGTMFAVHATNGSLVWKTLLDPHPNATMTQSPLIHKNIVYIGVSSNEEMVTVNPDYMCCTFRGSMNALNLTNGAVLWKTYMVPENYSGGAIWSSSPAIDESRNALYITTGNNYHQPVAVIKCLEDPTVKDKERCVSPDDHIDSIVAIDFVKRPGTIMWATKLWHLTDAWNDACREPKTKLCPHSAGEDYDFAQGAMLFSATIAGKKQDLIGAGQKSGLFWTLNRDTGRVVWMTDTGPGSRSGGLQWGSTTDGARIFYANSNFFHQKFRLKNGELTECGTWGALDAATGAILWQTVDPKCITPLTDPDGKPTPGFFARPFGPMTSTSSELVFAGSMDHKGTGYALHARTGAVLWSYEMGGSICSAPSIVDGVVFWGSGYGKYKGDATSSNKVIAFHIDPNFRLEQ